MGISRLLDIGNHIFPVVDITIDFAGSFQGAVCFTDLVFEHILTIHSNGVGSRETGDFFSSRVEVGDPQFLIRCKEAIRNAIQYFDKTFLFLVNLLQSFVNVMVDLASQKIAPSPGMHFPSFLKIAAGVHVEIF